jgi:hypothetical protein
LHRKIIETSASKIEFSSIFQTVDMSSTSAGGDRNGGVTSKCTLCNVHLTSDIEAQKHYAGKRHAKVADTVQKSNELCARSVFLFGFGRSGEMYSNRNPHLRFKYLPSYQLAVGCIDHVLLYTRT